MSNQYRIHLQSDGQYIVQRKGWLFWYHHSGHHPGLHGEDGAAMYFRPWYNTLEDAKKGVSAREDYDRLMQGVPPQRKYYYPPKY